MKKARRTAFIGMALVLSAALLIAFTAFFSVFDANRKVNEFVDTLPGQEEDVQQPLPDEPETVLPDDAPEVTPSDPPTVAEAANENWSKDVNLGTTYKMSGASWSKGASWGEKSEWKYYSISVTLKNGGSNVPNLSHAIAGGAVNVYFGLDVKNKMDDGKRMELYCSINNTSYNLSGSANSGRINSTKTKLSSTSFTVNFKMLVRSDWGDKGEIGNLYITLEKNDSTAPSFNVSTNAKTSVRNFKVNDSAAGVNRIAYRYNGGSETTLFTASSRTTSTTQYFKEGKPGTYVLTAYDSVGNSSSITVNYCEVNLKLSAYTNGTVTNSSDNKTVSTAGGKITTSSTVSGLNAGQTAKYTVTVNPGYVFVGMNYSTNNESTASYNSSTSMSGMTVTVQNVVSSATTSHTVCGFFIQIGIDAPTNLVYNGATKSATVAINETNLSSTKNVAPTAIGNFINILFPKNVPSSSYFKITYSGKTLGGNSTTSTPKYAGTYTPSVKCTYGGSVYGTYTGSAFTVSPMTVYIAPTISSSSKTYDGADTVSPSGWGIYSDSGATTAYKADGLSVKGISGAVLKLSSKDAGTRTFGLSNYGSLTLDNSNKDILNSYKASVITTKAKWNSSVISTYTVNKCTVNITAMVIRKKTSATTSEVYSGKVYDKSNALGSNVVAFVYTSSDGASEFNNLTQYGAGTVGIGIKLGNMVSGETLNAAFSAASETVSFSKPTFTASTANTYNISLTNVNVTSDNYTKGSSGVSVKGIEITKKPISVSFSLNTKLTYDGSDAVSASELAATLSGVIDGDTLKVSNASGKLSDKNAGSAKTITVTGYGLSGNSAGNYSISNTSYTISDVTVNKRTVTIPSWDYSNPSKTYDGTTTALKENVSLSYSGNVPGEDENNGVGTIIEEGFTVEYSSANAGNVNIIITVTPHSNYNIVTTVYSVTAKIDPKPLTSTGISLALKKNSFVYSGDEYLPELTTHTDKLGNGNTYVMIEGTDYSVNIPKVVTKGTYTATVTGKGNYTGSKTLQYEVTAGDYTMDLGAKADVTLEYGDTLKSVLYYFPDLSITENEAGNTVAGSWYFDYGDLTYNDEGLEDRYTAGTYTIYAVFTVADEIKNNFEYASKNIDVTLTVNKADVTITVDDMVYYYAEAYDFDFGSAYEVDRTTGIGKWGDHYTVEGIPEGDEENLYGLTFSFAKKNGFEPEKGTVNETDTYEDAITLSAYVSPNYNVTVVPGSVTISALPVVLSPVAGQSKYYGEADPELQYSLSTSVTLIDEYVLNVNGEISGKLLRDEGESTGFYNYDVSKLGSDNYALTKAVSASVTFQIRMLPVKIAPGNIELYYGQTFISPSTANGLTFTAEIIDDVRIINGKEQTFTPDSDVVQDGNDLVSEIAGVNALTITFRTTAANGSPAGTYPITVENCYGMDKNGINNFVFKYDETGIYSINKLPVKIIAGAVTKQFADPDPTAGYFTAEINGDIAVDASFNLASRLSGNLVRQPGENVGSYGWLQGTLTPDANPSFDLTYDLTTNSFNISRREIRLNVSNIAGIVYGEDIPAIFGEAGAGDGLNSGEWSLAPGSAFYGNGFDTSLYPSIEFSINGGLKIVLSESDFDSNNDLKTKRDEAGNAISYDLAPDSVLAEYLSADSDKSYIVTQITGLESTFFVEPVKAVVYLDPTKNAAFTFGTSADDINKALAGMFLIKDNRADSLPLNLDEFEGVPVLADADGTVFADVYPKVGKYIMDISTVKHKNDSYDVELLSDQYIVVSPKTLAVIVTGGNSHEFGAESDSVIEYTLQGEVDGFKVGDARLSRDKASGTYTEQMTVGSYIITYGALTNANYPNYYFDFDANYYYTITPRVITVVPIAASSVFGSRESAIGYNTYYNYDPQAAENETGLLNNDKLGGSLQRANSDISDAGVYEIERGTLNLAGVNGYNPNYLVTVESGVYYTIERKDVTVYADTAATHSFGLSFYDPEVDGNRLSFTYSSNDVDVSLLKGNADIDISEGGYDAETDLIMPGEYPVNQGTMTDENNNNYNITFVPRTRNYVVSRGEVIYYVGSAQYTYGAFTYEGGNLLTSAAFADLVVVTGLVRSGANNEYYGDFTSDISLYLQNTDAGMLDAGSYQYRYEYLGIEFMPGSGFQTAYYNVRIAGDGNALDIGAAPLALRTTLDGTALSASSNNLFYYNAEVRAFGIGYEGIIGEDDISVIEHVTLTKNDGSATVAADDIQSVGRYVASVYVELDESNYYISGKGSSLINVLNVEIEIEKASITVAADILPSESLTKFYGEEDPLFTASAEGVGGETVEFYFIRAAGENAGVYKFSDVILDEAFAANYQTALTASETMFKILPARVVADPSQLLDGRLNKTYGEEDPDLTAVASGVNGETLSVAFTREPGETRGEYPISSVTSADGNYLVSLPDTATIFVIDPKAASVTANDASAFYNGFDFSASEPTLTYTLSGFIASDVPVTGKLAVSGPAVHAGEYAIVAAEAFENDNYEITFNAGKFTILRRPVTVSSFAIEGVQFLFDPELDYFYAEGSFGYTAENLADGETLNGELGDLRMQAGNGIAIPQGSLTDEFNPDYSITYIAGTIDVAKITLLITPEESSSYYGETDNEIPYSVIRKDGVALPADFELAGALSYAKTARERYEDVGSYFVTLGNLSEANPDYVINFAPGAETVAYTVLPRPVTITIADAETVYGDTLKELTMKIDGMGLAAGDNSLTVTLQRSDPDNVNVGKYAIYLKDSYDDDNPNYDITVYPGTYSITPRPVSVHLNDQAADWNVSGKYTINQHAFDIIEGNVIDGDSLGIVITSDIGLLKRKYPLSATASNPNYSVTFNDDATFEVRKFSAEISVPSFSFEFIYTGEEFSVEASLNSGAEIIYSWEFGGKIYHTNSFVEVGKYVVTLSAGETADYYAPEDVTINITIKREALTASESGIEIVVDNEDGFDPDTQIEIEKIDQNDKDLNEVISSNETIVRAFNITTNDDSDKATSITVRVPQALQDLETVKVLVKQDGVYSVRLLNVEDGCVTINSADSVSAFAFVKEEPTTNYLMIILLGGAALIIVLSATIFLLKKRS